MKKIVGALVISLIIPAFAGAAIQDIQVSNNTSAGVNISWITDSATTGKVHYSKNSDLSNSLTEQSFVGCTHYVIIENLAKETTYYFEVVSGGKIDNNNGSYYTFKTMKEPSLYTPFTIYGKVYKEEGSTPAEGAIVYLRVTHGGVDSYLLSGRIASNGYFTSDIKGARSVVTDDLFPSIDTGDLIHLKAVYCGGYITHSDLEFEYGKDDYGSFILESSPSNTTTPTTTSTIAPTTVPTTTPSTTPTTAPSPTTIPPPPVDGTTTTSSASTTSSTSTSTKPSTTTTLLSTTTTIIPLPECEVTINISSANILPWETLKFSARTSCNEEMVIGTYLWYLDSTIGSSINESGLYQAGAVIGTDTVTVIDKANGDITATAVIIVSPLWPMAYDEMWGAKKGENLFLLRTFRDGVLADNEVGRDYIFMLYTNSLEILILFIQNPPLIQEIKEMIDELLPGIQSILDGGKMTLSKRQLADIESFLIKFETKASPELKTAIRKVKKDLNRGEVLKQLGIIIG